MTVINDDSSVPWTMFNDNVQTGFFDVYDQYLVNILYDPRIRPGMTNGEVDVAAAGYFSDRPDLGCSGQFGERRKLARWLER